jgi:ankyrin repeat protein
MSSEELHPEPEEYSPELYPEPKESNNENQPSPMPPPETCTVGTIKELCHELMNLREEQRDFVLTKDFWEENKENLNEVCEGRTALGLATEHSASSGLVRKIFWQLLDHKADIHAKDDEGRTAFSYVALLREKPGRSNGAYSPESVYKPSPKHSSSDARCSGRWLAWNEYCLDCLKKDDVSLIDQPDDSGRTPLSYAAEEGNMEMAEFIVKESKSGDVFKADKTHRSPLSFAAKRQNHKMIAFLVEKAKSIDKRHFHRDVDDQGLTPLHWLHRVDLYKDGGYKEQEHNRESNDGSWSHGFSSCGSRNNNSVDVILGYLGFGQPKDRSSYPGFNNAPNCAVEPGVLEQLNQTVKDGKTLLSYAILINDDGLINSLCNRVQPGLCPDVANDDDQKTALMLALERDESDGHSQILKQLVPLANREGALQAVIQRGECKLFKRLLVYLLQGTGEDEVRRADLNRTVLDVYFKHVTLDAAVPLLQTVFDELDPWLLLNRELNSGKRPLDEARNMGERSKELVDILLKKGANPDIWTQMRNWDWCQARPDQCLFTLSKSKSNDGGFASYAFDYVSHEALEQAVAEDKKTILL